MMNRLNRNPLTPRRGIVVVYTAAILTVLLGFAALSIDIGYLYMIRGELQNAADAGALAAAGQLAAFSTDRLTLARQMAVEYAGKNMVLNKSPQLDPDVDVTFGQAVLNDATNRFEFVPNTPVVDSVRVRVRRTSDSANGSVPLFFANIFGKSETDLWADATAILVPRDIAIVADLSASLNDDSELQHMNMTEVNLWDVWAALPGGLDQADANYSPQNAGPVWGSVMEQLGFGELTVDSNYDPTSDPGLVKLDRNQNWSSATIQSALQAQGYNANEVSAILSGSYDGTSSIWRARVAVALGLAVWRSGKGVDSQGQPAKWQAAGLAAGDGDSRVEWDTELQWVEDYPYPGGSWSDYFNYAASTWTQMYSMGSQDFRYRFGVKTFVNYLLERHPSYAECPDLHLTPAQPFQAIKESLTRMSDIIQQLEAVDRISLEIYGEMTRHEVDLSFSSSDCAERLMDMQAGHYDGWTNMGGGIQRGIDELSSERSRFSAIKVMVVLTDGKANVTENGTTGDYEGGRLYALAKAQEAANLGIRIYTVSVGADADTATMEQIAQIGKGAHSTPKVRSTPIPRSSVPSLRRWAAGDRSC